MFLKKFKKPEKKLINSFKYAYQGMIGAFGSERNMKIHFTIMMLVILFGVLFKISCLEWVICFLLFVLVISFELMNTALETTVDLITTKIDPKAKLAKDTSAGSVLFASIFAFLIGLMIFLPRIVVFIDKFI